MQIIDYKINNGKDNMQIDGDLLEEAIFNKVNEPIMRLYGWKPACVSLGRNQNSDFLDLDLLKNLNIDVVRRLTGGRALLHDEEITYCYVCPENFLENGESVINSYKEICKIFIDKFIQLGIQLTFGTNKAIKTKEDYCMLLSTGADLCYQNKKLIGSAQSRKNGYILQHGSILYDYDKNLLQKIFGDSINLDCLTSIKEINSDITKDDIINLFSDF